ncbi:MAG: type I restriction-modification system subunit M [Bacteroidaceae bacterium]|nr:type I restriction-modification system subunit M [Bacteroidaceae bacterium]
MANTNQEREELHKTIWAIADQLRGPVGGWEFKAYVLGSIFYRFISENITNYINKAQHDAGDADFDYTTLSDAEAEYARELMVEEKGFFILPSQLFQNVAKHPETDENLNETLSNIFHSIEASAIGTPSEPDLKGLFSDFVVDNSQLGNSVSMRNALIANVLVAVRDMNLGREFGESQIDTFGDAYEYLMQMYAANAGKSGGEFFTPQEVSEVLARIASYGNRDIQKVYDPACGSGSLLMKFAKIVGKGQKSLKYYGQEVNPTTYNLCRINMFLHDINYDNFDIQLGDTLHEPLHLDEAPFDAIVSNPPYSLKWDGKDNPILINDDRYAPAGVLAPKSAADLAFTMHMLYHLSESGTAAIVEFPGVLYRGGDEQKIRKYLVNNNYVDTVIQLPQNLFFGVGIATCIIVLKKSCKRDNCILFVDASNQFVKSGNKNKLTQKNQDAIVRAYAERKDVQYFCRLVHKSEIEANDFNLSVSSYVEQEDTREVIDIDAVNASLVDIVAEVNALRSRVDAIIANL